MRQIKSECLLRFHYLLFEDVIPTPPTTREIVEQVKRKGRARLPGALRRADEAFYQEVHMPQCPEPRKGHTVRVDAQPVSRMYAWVPLLLRTPIPKAVGAQCER